MLDNFKSYVERMRRLLLKFSSIFLLVLGLLFLIISHLLCLDDLVILILNSLGVSSLSAGVIGVSYNLLIRNTFLQEVKLNIEEQFKDTYSTLKTLSNNGIHFCYNRFPSEPINQSLKKANDRILILETWIGNYKNISKELENAIARGVSVEILLLDPESDHVKCRNTDIDGSHSDTYVFHNISTNIDDIKSLFNKYAKDENRLSLKLYDCTPIFTAYIIDDICFNGFFWRGKDAENGTYFRVNNLDKVDTYGHNIMMHYESISSTQNTISQKWLVKKEKK